MKLEEIREMVFYFNSILIDVRCRDATQFVSLNATIGPKFPKMDKMAQISQIGLNCPKFQENPGQTMWLQNVASFAS